MIFIKLKSNINFLPNWALNVSKLLKSLMTFHGECYCPLWWYFHTHKQPMENFSLLLVHSSSLGKIVPHLALSSFGCSLWINSDTCTKPWLQAQVSSHENFPFSNNMNIWLSPYKRQYSHICIDQALLWDNTNVQSMAKSSLVKCSKAFPLNNLTFLKQEMSISPQNMQVSFLQSLCTSIWFCY
jgi:hypothetical protein